jgi:hypothetical protein
VTALTVHLNRSDLVDDLVTAFCDSGCGAQRVGLRSCTVEHRSAHDEREARVEVTFFLRAWQSRHPFARASLAG